MAYQEFVGLCLESGCSAAEKVQNPAEKFYCNRGQRTRNVKENIRQMKGLPAIHRVGFGIRMFPLSLAVNNTQENNPNPRSTFKYYIRKRNFVGFERGFGGNKTMKRRNSSTTDNRGPSPNP